MCSSVKLPSNARLTKMGLDATNHGKIAVFIDFVQGTSEAPETTKVVIFHDLAVVAKYLQNCNQRIKEVKLFGEFLYRKKFKFVVILNCGKVDYHLVKM